MSGTNPSSGVLPIIKEVVAAEKSADEIVNLARTESDRQKSEQIDRHRLEMSEAIEAVRILTQKRIEEARRELKSEDGQDETDVVFDPEDVEITIGEIVELILKTWIED